MGQVENLTAGTGGLCLLDVNTYFVVKKTLKQVLLFWRD